MSEEDGVSAVPAIISICQLEVEIKIIKQKKNKNIHVYNEFSLHLSILQETNKIYVMIIFTVFSKNILESPILENPLARTALKPTISEDENSLRNFYKSDFNHEVMFAASCRFLLVVEAESLALVLKCGFPANLSSLLK